MMLTEVQKKREKWPFTLLFSDIGFYFIIALIIILITSTVQAQTEPLIFEAEALQLEIHVSRTAHLFHVVDQLSLWSEFCHDQYRDGMAPLSAADLSMLTKHIALRDELSWGQGLEQTFYTPLPLDEAIEQGIRNGWITPSQAKIEREVFTHFSERIDNLVRNERDHLIRFQKKIQEQLPDLNALSGKLSRFYLGSTPRIPVYLLANPHDRNHGGGYNGERLTLEVPRVKDAYPVLVHEIMHAFQKAQHDRIEAAVAGIENLDGQTLNEGIAHALAPGLLHTEGENADPLRRRAIEELARGESLEQSYARYHRYALALRPLLKEALDDESQTLETFLPRAIDAWRMLVELDSFYIKTEHPASLNQPTKPPTSKFTLLPVTGLIAIPVIILSLVFVFFARKK